MNRQFMRLLSNLKIKNRLKKSGNEERFKNTNSKIQIFSKETSQVLYKLHKDAKNDIWKAVPLFGVVLSGFVKAVIAGKNMFSVVSPSEASNLYLPVAVEDGFLLYNLVISTNAKLIVEFGTSFGISTIYLAAAAKKTGGIVLTSEIESSKIKVAKKNLEDAGLSKQVEFLEGDARETILTAVRLTGKKIDLLFLDGWKDLYVELLKKLENELRDGSLIVADNVDMPIEPIKLYLDYVRNPENNYISANLGERTEVSTYHIN